MKLGIVKHNKSVTAHQVAMIIDRDFTEIEYVFLEYDNLDRIDDLIKANYSRLDALLFLGKLSYDVASKSMVKSILMEHLSYSKYSIINSFMHAHLVYGYDLNKISCATTNTKKILQIQEDLEINDKLPELLLASTEQYNKISIEECYQLNKKAYLNGEIDFIISTVTGVLEKLKADNIPCEMVTHAEISIKSKLRRLLMRNIAEVNKSNQIIVIAISIDRLPYSAIQNYDEYYNSIQQLKIYKEIYKFSKATQSAIMEIGNGNFLLFSTRNVIERETDGFTKMDLIDKIRDTKCGTISMAIGFGATANQAKKSALKGQYHSQKQGGNCAFVVFDDNNMFILNKSVTSKEISEKVDKRINDIAINSKLGINTVFKLIRVVEQYSIEEITAKELALLYGITHSSMNKIISKLEACNYVKIISNNKINQRGRPSRIIRFNFG
ncbi:MAG: hypothetical protein N4A68_08420 [Maledivibacter sp.]|jgi:hypothetical protein|nr:hypothetical protein [Maledivibacter sp.]